MTTDPTPAPLADTLDRLADELARLPHLPETGGDGHLNRIIPLARDAASDLRRRAAIETAAQVIADEAVQTMRGDSVNRLWRITQWQLDDLRAALATAAQPAAEGR
jgi:hypothetical protein